MADDSMLMKVGLFAGAGYLAYKFGYLSFLGGMFGSSATAPASPANPAAPANTPPAPASPSPALILRGLIERSKAAWGSGADCGDAPTVTYSHINGMLVPNPDSLGAFARWSQCKSTDKGEPMFDMDGWNTLAVQAGGPSPMPDPAPLFPGMDRSTKMNVGQYWGGMAPVLAKQGLSGYLRRRGVRV